MNDSMEDYNWCNSERDELICSLPYEQAVQDEKMHEKLKDLRYKWEKLGFVDRFQDERKDELSYAFEQLAVFLLYFAENDGNKLFKDENKLYEVLGFPIIRIVIGSLEPNEFDFQKFLEYSKVFNVFDIYNSIKNKAFMQIDAEAEACGTASKMIVTKFKNPNKDVEEIRKEILYQSL